MTKLAHRHSRLGGLHRANKLSAKRAVMETVAKKISTNGCDGLPESMTRMTASSENQKEAATMTAEILNVKTKTRIGFCNGCTNYVWSWKIGSDYQGKEVLRSAYLRSE